MNVVGTVVRVRVRTGGSTLFVQSWRLVDFNEWELPGGKLNDGESTYEAGKRELWEETNLELIRAKIIVDWHRRTPFDTYWRFVLYEALEVSGDAQIIDPREIKGLDWFPDHSPPRLDAHNRALYERIAA